MGLDLELAAAAGDGPPLAAASWVWNSSFEQLVRDHIRFKSLMSCKVADPWVPPSEEELKQLAQAQLDMFRQNCVRPEKPEENAAVTTMLDKALENLRIAHAKALAVNQIDVRLHKQTQLYLAELHYLHSYSKNADDDGDSDGGDTLNGERRNRSGIRHSKQVLTLLQEWSIENRKRPRAPTKKSPQDFGPFPSKCEELEMLEKINKLPGGETFTRPQLKHWFYSMRSRDWLPIVSDDPEVRKPPQNDFQAGLAEPDPRYPPGNFNTARMVGGMIAPVAMDAPLPALPPMPAAVDPAPSTASHFIQNMLQLSEVPAAAAGALSATATGAGAAVIAPSPNAAAAAAATAAGTAEPVLKRKLSAKKIATSAPVKKGKTPQSKGKLTAARIAEMGAAAVAAQATGVTYSSAADMSTAVDSSSDGAAAAAPTTTMPLGGSTAAGAKALLGTTHTKKGPQHSAPSLLQQQQQRQQEEQRQHEALRLRQIQQMQQREAGSSSLPSTAAQASPATAAAGQSALATAPAAAAASTAATGTAATAKAAPAAGPKITQI